MSQTEKVLTEESKTNYEGENKRFFDNYNPLTSQILTKEQVASTFGKSLTWVTRMISCGALTAHYAGETPMFYWQEVLDAFLSDSLAKRRRQNDKKNKEQKQNDQLRSTGKDHRQVTLSNIRKLS
ncbi:MAG: hypothetical protein U1F57_09175 [bacterium]